MASQSPLESSSNYWPGNYQPMGMRFRRSRTERFALNTGINFLVRTAPALARVGPLRRAAVRTAEKRLQTIQQAAVVSGFRPVGVEQDRHDLGLAMLHTIERALAENQLSPATRRTVLCTLVRDNLFLQGNWDVKEGFRQRNGVLPPDFLLVSPGKACNLHCVGCYADSGANREKLDWAVLEQLIRDANDRLGNRFFVISGGEPMAYQSDGKGVLDLAERFPDSLFLMYTNGTLIDDKIAKRLAALGTCPPRFRWRGCAAPPSSAAAPACSTASWQLWNACAGRRWPLGFLRRLPASTPTSCFRMKWWTSFSSSRAHCTAGSFITCRSAGLSRSTCCRRPSSVSACGSAPGR